jgi:hypothetical protein
MLTVVETLEPTERAVFVLHQVFDMPYGDRRRDRQVHDTPLLTAPGLSD